MMLGMGISVSFSSKIKSTKNSTIHPIQVYDAVTEYHRVCQCGKINLDGQFSDPSDVVQIARELNNTG